MGAKTRRRRSRKRNKKERKQTEWFRSSRSTAHTIGSISCYFSRPTFRYVYRFFVHRQLHDVICDDSATSRNFDYSFDHHRVVVVVVLATAQKICSYTLFRLFISLSALAIKNTVVAKKAKRKKIRIETGNVMCSSFFWRLFQESLFLLSERLFFPLNLG